MELSPAGEVLLARARGPQAPALQGARRAAVCPQVPSEMWLKALRGPACWYQYNQPMPHLSDGGDASVKESC